MTLFLKSMLLFLKTIISRKGGKKGNHGCHDDRNCADSLLQIPEFRVIPKTHIVIPKKPFFQMAVTDLPVTMS
jgi:hypothetical protein